MLLLQKKRAKIHIFFTFIPQIDPKIIDCSAKIKFKTYKSLTISLLFDIYRKIILYIIIY